jgi:hypothetical protein
MRKRIGYAAQEGHTDFTYQRVDVLTMCLLAQRPGQWIPAKSLINWWAHKDSNLGPAD